jgi:hypothetical protein
MPNKDGFIIHQGYDSAGSLQEVGQSVFDGAALTSNWYFEVSKGHVPNQSFIHKFGRNSDINVASGFEAVWNGGGPYTGFNATAAETLEVFSSNIADAGTLVSSGTATSGTTTKLIDTGATFVVDGVAVGDLIINDTQKVHGIVTAVAETELTTAAWDRSIHVHDEVITFAAGDAYRIAAPASTGLAAVVLEHCLDGDLDNESVEYVILNGTTAVDTVGTYRRQSRGRGLIAGSGLVNAGGITSRQKTTTANVMMVMPIGANQTTIAAYTVPITKIAHMLGFSLSLSGKVQANVNGRLRTRHRNEVFVNKEEVSISGAGSSFIARHYTVPKNDLAPGTDIVIEADTDVNSTGVAAGFDLILSDIP